MIYKNESDCIRNYERAASTNFINKIHSWTSKKLHFHNLNFRYFGVYSKPIQMTRYKSHVGR